MYLSIPSAFRPLEDVKQSDVRKKKMGSFDWRTSLQQKLRPWVDSWQILGALTPSRHLLLSALQPMLNVRADGLSKELYHKCLTQTQRLPTVLSQVNCDDDRRGDTGHSLCLEGRQCEKARGFTRNSRVTYTDCVTAVFGKWAQRQMIRAGTESMMRLFPYPASWIKIFSSTCKRSISHGLLIVYSAMEWWTTPITYSFLVKDASYNFCFSLHPLARTCTDIFRDEPFSGITPQQ